MNPLAVVARAVSRPVLRATAQPGYRIDDYLEWISQMPLVQTTMSGNREELSTDFLGLVAQAYRNNGVVFACILTRMMLFGEMRFAFQQLRGGTPGDLFGTPDLSILESPEPGMTTGDLARRTLLFADLGGTGFIVRRPGRLRTLRPDWTTIVIGSSVKDTSTGPPGIDSELAGVIYHPGGRNSSAAPQTFLASELAVFAPIPDAMSRYTGMSALTAVRREVMGDSAATTHKQKFFENAATPNMIVKLGPGLPTIEKARQWIELFEQEHEGSFNAYRTAYLGAGMEAEAVGKDMQQLDFKATQGAGETRIVAAFNLHPTVVPMSEGLAGSSLNEGNFSSASRLVGDKFLRPNWGDLAGSVQRIVPAPAGSRLWFDDRGVAFLAEAVKDRADVFLKQATATRTLTDGGFKPASVIAAVSAEDITRLEHTGLVPVQLQAPGAGQEPGAMGLYRPVDGAMAAFPEYFAQAGATPPVIGQVRALQTFWPTSGAARGRHVEAGELIAANDPAVLLFGQFFEPVASAPIALLGSGQSAEVRCRACGRLLAEQATAPYRFTCWRPGCKTVTEAA